MTTKKKKNTVVHYHVAKGGHRLSQANHDNEEGAVTQARSIIADNNTSHMTLQVVKVTLEEVVEVSVPVTVTRL